MPEILEGIKLLFPYYCIVCRKRTYETRLCSFCSPPSGNGDCGGRCYCCFMPLDSWSRSSCCTLCRIFPLPLRRVRCLWSYSDARARNLINCMKYRPSPALTHIAGRLMAQSTEDLFGPENWDLIVPVPSSGASLRERRFNQCLILARAVGERVAGTGAKVSPAALFLGGPGKPQASLAHDRRISNIRGRFHADRRRVSGKDILLVEDVITTGATSQAAALSLLDAGAASVDVIALARADAWTSSRYHVFKGFRRRQTA